MCSSVDIQFVSGVGLPNADVPTRRCVVDVAPGGRPLGRAARHCPGIVASQKSSGVGGSATESGGTDRSAGETVGVEGREIRAGSGR